MPKKEANRSVRIFCGFFILIGIVAIGCGVWILFRSLTCARWPTTEGVVDQAEMKYHSSDEGGTYAAEITYRYKVAGTNYTSTRRAFGEASSSAAYAQGILKGYPAGKIVTVHYSPNDPELAVLETGIHGGMWICLGVGTVFVLAGAMFLQSYQNDSVTAHPMPSTQTGTAAQEPPMLMGIIFILMGSFVCFVPSGGEAPSWILYAVGGMFVLIGLSILASRLRNKIWCKALAYAAVMAFMSVFHWISFGPGERIGTSTIAFSSFSGSTVTNVKIYFAAFTLFMDAALLAGLIRWLIKRRNNG